MNEQQWQELHNIVSASEHLSSLRQKWMEDPAGDDSATGRVPNLIDIAHSQDSALDKNFCDTSIPAG